MVSSTVLLSTKRKLLSLLCITMSALRNGQNGVSYNGRSIYRTSHITVVLTVIRDQMFYNIFDRELSNFDLGIMAIL